MRMKFTSSVVGLVLLSILAQARTTDAAEITVLCSNGIRAVMQELVPQFEQASHHKVAITFGLTAALKRQIDAGETFDLALLTPQAIDELIKTGKIVSNTRTVIAQSSMALVIRAGSRKPDVGTLDALKRTLAGAKSITYAREGASGVYVVELMQKLALTDTLKPKLRLADSGEQVGRWIKSGEADLGVLPVSEILPVDGIEVGGTFPAPVQGSVVMAAGVGIGAKQAAAAKELIKFLASPAAVPVIKKKGMERG